MNSLIDDFSQNLGYLVDSIEAIPMEKSLRNELVDVGLRNIPSVIYRGFFGYIF